MKFVSKSVNLLIVLSPGLSAQPLTGTPAKPTVSVRFKDGVADVPDGKLTEMMLAHPGFNGDFISVDDAGGKDPYEAARDASEPAHVVTDVQFGTPVASKVYGGKVKLSPEMQVIVKEAATALAKEMLPEMIQETLKGLVTAHEEDKKEAVKTVAKEGKKKGRPAGEKIVEKSQEPKPVESEVLV